MHQALAALVQRAQDAGQFAARRDAAEHGNAVAPQAERGVVRDQRGGRRRAGGQSQVQVLRCGYPFGQFAAQRCIAAHFTGAFAAFEIGQRGRQHLSQRFAGLAGRVGDRARRMMVAGNHAPQPAADDDGQAHRRLHAHVRHLMSSGCGSVPGAPSTRIGV
ncbi:hypothetical protein G6F68_016873 [Rhizopus microsporus]|nr:hypothetical protein G6F68_016873 [Rhizopus microsporus]